MKEIELNLNLFNLTILLFNFISAPDAYELSFSTSDTLTLGNSNSPYEFNKTVLIPLGKTLVIEPGVELRLAPSISVHVEGTLIANGTNEQRIKFKPLANSDYFDSSFSSRFANVNLTDGLCVRNSDERANKEVASAICREMGYMGESNLFNVWISQSNQFLSVSKCDIKSTFLKDNCLFSLARQCSNSFRSVRCSQPPIHNYWSGLFFTQNANRQANKSVLAFVDFEKGGLNKTCCSPSQINHGVINIQQPHLVILNDVKISDSASNGLSIQNTNENATIDSFDFNGIQINNVFLNAIEVWNTKISDFTLSNSEIKTATRGLLVGSFNGTLRVSNSSIQSNRRGIHVNDQPSTSQLNVTLSQVSFLSDEMAVDDESNSRLTIEEVKFHNSTGFGIRKSKGSLRVSSTEFRNNNVSVFVINSNDLDVQISRNNFSQDLKHSVYCNDTHQDSLFTLRLTENRFERNELQTVQITLKLAKNTTQSRSNVLIDVNTFTENVGLSVLDLRFVYDFDSLTNYPNRVRITNNKFLDNQVYTYDDPSVSIKKHGVLEVSLGSSLSNVAPQSNATGYQWQQALRNVLVENNTFANPKSTFEVATFYMNYSMAHEHLVKLDISSNNWLSYSNELDILSHINAFHLNQNLSILVQIYPLYMNGILNAFSPSGSIVASDNQLGFYVNKDFVLEAGVYTCPYGMLIEQGSSLTIKPNVTIEFQPNTKILVLGKLDLKGELNKQVHLKLVQASSKSNQTNSSSSSFNYEKRLRLSPLNISSFAVVRNYKLVEVFVDSKWQPICYNWNARWTGWIHLRPPLADFLPLLCKWMGLVDCSAQGVELIVNIFTYYENYVNEFDFDPNFHSNISEVRLSTCKSNCECQTFLAFLPVTTNTKPQSAAIHYTTYAKSSLITHVLTSIFSNIFRIDNLKHLIENVLLENGNSRSLNALTIHKQDRLNTYTTIRNVKSTPDSLGPVSIWLFQNGLSLSALSNISITNHLVANPDILNSEFDAFHLHVDECEPRVHLENEQITLMTLNSVNNLSCSMNLSANVGQQIAITLIGVERTLCSTILSIRSGTSDAELLLLLRTSAEASNGELRSFFASNNNALSIQLTFSSSCSKWNHLKLKFESIDSTIDVNLSSVNADSVKIADSHNITLINKITRHTPNVYSTGKNKEMRVENTSLWSWLVEDAYNTKNLKLKDIYQVFVNNVSFGLSVTSDQYSLSDVRIENSNFKLIPTKFNIYKMTILNSQFEKTIEGFYSYNYLNIIANYLNLENNTFVATRIGFISPCFEMRNNRFLRVETNQLISLDTDQDILKLAPQSTCKQIIESSLFLGNHLYSSYGTLLFADFSQYSYWHTYLRNKNESSRLELNVQFRNNVLRNLRCSNVLRFNNQYNVQFEPDIRINVELDNNLFVDTNRLDRIITINLADEITVKLNNNTFSNVSTLSLIDSIGIIQLEMKANKFVNSAFYGQMKLFVGKQFAIEHNEFIDNIVYSKNMFTLYVLDSSEPTESRKGTLKSNTFNRNSFRLDYYFGYYYCEEAVIQIECVRLDHISISENLFNNSVLIRFFVYPLDQLIGVSESYQLSELIIKFTEGQPDPDWFTKDFILDLSSNRWGTTRTKAQMEKLVYVKSTAFDSLFKAKLSESVTSSIESSLSSSCSPIGGYLPSGQTLELTKANSPYYIYSTWIIETGARVEVEPGVDIKMAQGVKVIVYGSFVMKGQEKQKIRINHNSVNCSHESTQICTFNNYNQLTINSINYIIFRTKQLEEQSVLRHVQLNKDISLFVDGYTPVIEHLMSENNKEDAGIIIFKSLNDINLNSVIMRSNRQYSVLIYEQEKNIRIDACIFNQTVLITKEISWYLKPYLLESINWGQEYMLRANEYFYLNFHLNSEKNDCFKKLFVVVRAEPGRIISIWSETSVNSLSNTGFSFHNLDNQRVITTDLYTQLTWQNYLKIEVLLPSCSQLNRIILRLKSLEAVFAINDFSEPNKSLLFPPGLFELNDSVSSWFVTNNSMYSYYYSSEYQSFTGNRLAFRFNQSSMNQTRLDSVESVELSNTELRICGLEFEIETFYNYWWSSFMQRNITFAIYLASAQSDTQIFSIVGNKVCHGLGCFEFFNNKKFRIYNGSLFAQHDSFKLKFQVLNNKQNLEIMLQDVAILKCHLAHDDSVDITITNSHLHRVIVESFEFTPHSYNVILDNNVFFDQKYERLNFETELKAPVQINVDHLNKFTMSNSMVYYSTCLYNLVYFTQIMHNYNTKSNYKTITNDKMYVEISSNYVWRNKFRGFFQVDLGQGSLSFYGYFKTIISNNTIKSNTFTQAMVWFEIFDLIRSIASIEITSNFITLNDGSYLISRINYGIYPQLPPKESPLVKINRNAFFFNNDFKIETSFPANLIEENAFWRNLALQDFYYIVYNSIVYGYNSLDVPSEIGNWWNTLDVSELADRFRNYNASRLLADIPSSLSKYNLKNSYCERGWSQLNGKCYLELPVQLAYANGVQTCANLSSALAKFDSYSFNQFKILRNSTYGNNDHVWLQAILDAQCRSIQTINGLIENNTSCLVLKHVVCEQEQTCSNLQCNQSNAICQGTRCICADGWHGPSCNEFKCIRMNNCSKRGTCIGPNRCVCEENWHGRSCSSHFCFLFDHCGTCTSQQGCGWCDEAKRCLPATRTDRQPEKNFNCSTWFYYNCLTPSDSKCSRLGIENMPNCLETFCDLNSTDFNRASCQQCLDFDKCFSNVTTCRAWNETKCPFGKLKPDYSDPNRYLLADVNPNVINVDSTANVVIFKCPINKPNSISKDVDVLLFKSDALADLIRLDSIIQSEQSKGIFHKVKRVQRFGDYRLVLAHMASLQELYTYADFEMPAKKMFELNENDELFEPVQDDLSTDLIARIRTQWNSSQAFEMDTSVHFMCQGKKYESIQNETLTQGYTLFVLVKKTNFTLQFAESDLIYSNASELAKYLETVNTIDVQNDDKYGEKVFVRTHLTNCNTELTEASLVNLLNSSVVSSDLDCFGGRNLNESVYVFENENMDNQQHRLFKPKDVIQGRSGTKAFVLQILSKRVFNDFLLFECKQIESLTDVNQLVYYERVFQVLQTKVKRIEAEAGVKVLIPKLGGSVSFGKVSLKTDFDLDADVNFNFKPFSVGFGMSISYDIVVTLNGALGFSREFDNKPIIWRFFIPAPPPFVRIPGEFAISGQPEVSIDVDTDVQTKVQFRGSKKFYKEFKLNDNSDTNLANTNPTLSKPPLNGNEFVNVKVEAKYTVQVKLAIPSYRIRIEKWTKLPDWIEMWELDVTLFEFNVFFSLPFGIRIEVDTCFDKCYDVNDEEAMALKIAGGNLGCEAGAGLNSFSASVQTKFNICDGGWNKNNHWCYKSIPKPPERCPCKCDDGTQSERDENGECKCECTCEDGTKDKIDKDDKCPCKCKCQNCKESVRKANGCYCPDDNQQCSEPGVVGRWLNCRFECEERNPCGNPPFCAPERRGPKCNTPFCPQGCANGICVASGTCGSTCRCFQGWQGARCEGRRTQGFGDPWFITFNGFVYGFQGLGEYWHCLDMDNDFGIQIRTYLIGGLNTYVSSISGAAVKLSNSVFTVFLNENGSYVMRLDGQIIPNKNQEIVLNNSMNGLEEVMGIDYSKRFIAIDRKDHSSVTLYMNSRHIEIKIDLYEAMNTSGLCGTANKLTDDFQGKLVDVVILTFFF